MLPTWCYTIERSKPQMGSHLGSIQIPVAEIPVALSKFPEFQSSQDKLCVRNSGKGRDRDRIVFFSTGEVGELASIRLEICESLQHFIYFSYFFEKKRRKSWKKLKMKKWKSEIVWNVQKWSNKNDICRRAKRAEKIFRVSVWRSHSPSIRSSTSKKKKTIRDRTAYRAVAGISRPFAKGLPAIKVSLETALVGCEQLRDSYAACWSEYFLSPNRW